MRDRPNLLNDKAEEIRRSIFKMICDGGGGHIPASLSIVEILVALYYEVLNVTPATICDPGRDRFILSKGHACVTLYAVLADLGFFDKSALDTFGRRGSILGGHPDMLKIPGVEASTGALGHGLPFGAGIAMAAKMDNRDFKVFVVMGDGECQEGSVWEAAMFAAQHRLDNLCVIIDYNRLQAMDELDKIVSVSPLADKWRAFGWQVKEADGHNIKELVDLCTALPFQPKKPSMIIANTIKGKGVSFMENEPIWHYRMPNGQEMRVACNELGIDPK
ncbi:transketolase [Candidatus Magnetominusculus dajiuhuensis]|uniref:transketolase n=1 Tax=Candidatus Magnetominusculus dajiuhuensis TaxID=3137712 RepID=UPI003B43C299